MERICRLTALGRIHDWSGQTNHLNILRTANHVQRLLATHYLLQIGVVRFKTGSMQSPREVDPETHEHCLKYIANPGVGIKRKRRL